MTTVHSANGRRVRRVAAAAVVLGSVLPAASFAQSSLVLYGRMDVTVGRLIGSGALTQQQGSGNRIGLRGVEDLGGGYKGVFHMEHTFNPDTGTLVDSTRFWNRRAYVGLETPYGRVWLGHEYTPAYLDAQLAADPNVHTMATTMIVFGRGGTISNVRIDSSANYLLNVGPVGLGLQLGQANGPLLKNVKKPFAASLRYREGPLYVAYGYDNPGGINDYWHFAVATYDIGPLRLYGGAGYGQTNAKAKTASVQAAVVYVAGVHELRAMFGRLDDRSAHKTQSQKTGLGYFYNFSKTTNVYANVAIDSRVTRYKTGWDVGLLKAF